MPDQNANLSIPAQDFLAFMPPPGAQAALPLSDQDLDPASLAAGPQPINWFKINNMIGTLGHRFEFVEPGGTNHLKPGRPLSQQVRIDMPEQVGFFVMLNGFNHAFVNGNRLTERPLGQMYATVGINFAARTLNCNVRLSDSNSDDAVHIIVDVVAVFFR